MKLSSLFEDYHGGDYQTGGQFPTSTLERSQSRKGVSDLFDHPDDEGQQGKIPVKKPKKKKNPNS